MLTVRIETCDGWDERALSALTDAVDRVWGLTPAIPLIRSLTTTTAVASGNHHSYSLSPFS